MPEKTPVTDITTTGYVDPGTGIRVGDGADADVVNNGTTVNKFNLKHRYIQETRLHYLNQLLVENLLKELPFEEIQKK